MNSTRWRTSSHSGGNGGECVQVAAKPSTERVLVRDRRVLVRDSKNPDGPVLALASADWRFTVYVKHLFSEI